MPPPPPRLRFLLYRPLLPAFIPSSQNGLTHLLPLPLRRRRMFVLVKTTKACHVTSRHAARSVVCTFTPAARARRNFFTQALTKEGYERTPPKRKHNTHTRKAAGVSTRLSLAQVLSTRIHAQNITPTHLPEQREMRLVRHQAKQDEVRILAVHAMPARRTT